jgi:hypothetical protein
MPRLHRNICPELLHTMEKLLDKRIVLERAVNPTLKMPPHFIVAIWFAPLSNSITPIV